MAEPATKFDYTPFLADDLPPPAARWTGFPTHNFIGGHNDREAIPVEGLIAALTKQLQEKGAELATYSLEGGPQGMQQLRAFVARKLSRDRGIACTADDVLITSGSLQGMDLINQLLLQPGDTVVVEKNNYGGTLSRLTRIGVDAVGVPLDEDGMRMDALAEVLDDLAAKGIRPKYIYTIPTVQNPTGSVLPLERRHRMLELARQHGVPIFEDECYADLVWEGEWPPALRGLDDRGQVIHIGSFSKTLAPALRIGYLVADWPVLSRLLALKTDAGTGALEQMAIAEYFGQHYDAHLDMLKPRLKRKMEIIAEAVSREFGTAAEFTRPKGGIFFWIRIPGVDTARLLEAAAPEGLQFNPGAAWSTLGAQADDCLRLCFALTTPEEIDAGIAKLAEICRREFGIPTRSGNVAHG